MPTQLPLKELHPESSLSRAKLMQLDLATTDELKISLKPGRSDCLKTRPDGTILDGHHRINILRRRNVNVDELPREIQIKEAF